MSAPPETLFTPSALGPSSAAAARARRCWWPQSLVARHTVLVLGIGVLSLLLHLVVNLMILRVLSADLVWSMASVVNQQKALLALTPAANRMALATALSSPRHRIERVPADSAWPAADDGLMARHGIVAKLRRQLAPGTQVQIVERDDEQAGPQLLFAFGLDGEHWRIHHQPTSPLLTAGATLAAWLLLLGVAALASVVVGVRWVGRPLGSIAAQLDDATRKLQALRMPADASLEVRRVVDSFNRLVAAKAEADATQQQLLAGVSHDLRTPLARLRFRVETECAQHSAPMAAELAHDLTVLERIVNQFLGYVQSEQAQVMGKPWPVAEVVAPTVRGFAASGADVAAETLDDAGLALPDVAVQRLLNNLVDNALAHGRAPVRVSVAPTADHRTLQLVVWDHGAGITEAEFEAVRRPFVRGGSSTLADNTTHGHCGLGLAIVEQLALHTGGRVALQRDGQGRFGVAVHWPLSAPTH
jgi:two-component system, OmpR family, osmolarity sensor histidine kinase EnvZ